MSFFGKSIFEYKKKLFENYNKNDIIFVQTLFYLIIKSVCYNFTLCYFYCCFIYYILKIFTHNI